MDLPGIPESTWPARGSRRGRSERVPSTPPACKLSIARFGPTHGIEIVRLTESCPPSFLMVLTGTAAAYRREDGVFVVPLATLAP